MFFKEFKDLRRKADRRLGLPDLLNYAFAEDDYTIVTKDGARLVAFECYGSDLNSASPAELDAHRALANRAFARFDDGFAYQVDLMRYASADHPERAFADPVSAMLGHEAALHYAHEGNHFESRCVLSYRLPPIVGGPVPARRGVHFRHVGRRRARARARMAQATAPGICRRRGPGMEADPARSVGASVAHHQLHQRADVPGEGASPSGAA